MGYKWRGMRKLTFEEVKERLEKGELGGCYKLYDDNTEAAMGPFTDLEDIKQHRDNGGEFGEELDSVELSLPDGKLITVPEVVDISELGSLDELEYSLWGVIEEYLALFGIRTQDDDPDWATVKTVQDSLLTVLMDAGVNFKLLSDEKQEEINKALEKKGRKPEFGLMFDVFVSDEDIDDIMVSALEGGINYWCNEAEVVGEYLGEYASEQISRGGTLRLYDFEEENWQELTREKFIAGLKKYIINPTASDICEIVDHEIRIDTCQADAEVADAIIQYAVFGDIIYG